APIARRAAAGSLRAGGRIVRSGGYGVCGGVQGGDVDLLHRHHGLEGGAGAGGIGVVVEGHQATRRDLPADAPAVLAPAALALLTAVADDGVPQAVGLGLVVGLDDEG